MAFFSRFKSVGAPAPSNDAASTRESVKKPILLRAHTSGINDLACDIKYVLCLSAILRIQQKATARGSLILILNLRQKRVWTVSRDGSIAVWEQVIAKSATHDI
jgi:hypothetical protein